MSKRSIKVEQVALEILALLIENQDFTRRLELLGESVKAVDDLFEKVSEGKLSSAVELITALAVIYRRDAEATQEAVGYTFMYRVIDSYIRHDLQEIGDHDTHAAVEARMSTLLEGYTDRFEQEFGKTGFADQVKFLMDQRKRTDKEETHAEEAEAGGAGAGGNGANPEPGPGLVA